MSLACDETFNEINHVSTCCSQKDCLTRLNSLQDSLDSLVVVLKNMANEIGNLRVAVKNLNDSRHPRYGT